MPVFQVLVSMLDDNESTFLPTGFKELRLLVPALPEPLLVRRRAGQRDAPAMLTPT